MNRIRFSNRAGITLTEVMVAAAITGLVSLSVVRTNIQIQDGNQRTQDTQMLLNYTNVILNQLAMEIKTVGSGWVPPDITNQTVFAAPVDPLANYMTELIMYTTDTVPLETMSSGDLWTRYSTGTSSGCEAIWIRKYASDNWLTIRNNLGTVVSQRFIRMPPGIHITQLRFTLLDSQNPARVANQRPNAASAVRVAIQLQKGKSMITQEKLILLENLLYAPH